MMREDQVSCRTFRRQLFHFQADELPESERAALEGHLDACPECARRLAFEDAFLAGIRGRLGRTPAPPGLRDRVGAALRREAPDPDARRWSRAPWLVPLAASLLLAALLVPVFGSGPTGGTIAVDRRVTLVDFDCDSHGRTVEQQRQCTDPHHLNALKTTDGRYWNISMDEEASRRLVVDERMRGHVLRVRGDLFAGIRTLRLSSYEDLGAAGLSAASGRSSVLLTSR